MANSENVMPRWGRQTQLAVENFAISGEQMPKILIETIAHIKQHAAHVNAEFGIVERPIAEAIAAAALEIRRGDHGDQFPLDVFQTGSGTSTNMNVNEVIAHRAGELAELAVHPNDDVNASQSSNDVFPTAIRIAVLVMIRDQLIPSLTLLANRLSELSMEHVSTVKSGRTHLMDAAPMTFGQEVSGWERSVRLAIERLTGLTPRLCEMPLGGTAVGTGLNAPEGFAAEVIKQLAIDLRLPLVEATNHFEAQSSQEPLVEASGTCRLVSLSLFKIAGDIRLLSSGPATGLGELVVADLQAGSSIMPGKVNPVILEVVQQVSAQVVGNDAAVAFAAATGSTLQLNTAMPVMARNLLESLRLLTSAANALYSKCFRELRVDTTRMSDYASRSPAIAAALNPMIGYDAAAKVAKLALAEGRSVADVATNEFDLTPEVLALLDPLTMTRGGLAKEHFGDRGDR